MGFWFGNFNSCESFFLFLVHVHEFISFSQRIVPALWVGVEGDDEFDDRDVAKRGWVREGEGNRGDVAMKSEVESKQYD